MAGFREFFSRRSEDVPEDTDTTVQQRSQKGTQAVRGPQEPILPNREVLEAEAGRLFVTKQKQQVAAGPAESVSPGGRKELYAGDAETKEPPPLESAMTKARAGVLDILERIDKAGIAISPELRKSVTSELTNLVSEAARIEFKEAEAADPVVILSGIFQKLAEKETIRALKNGLESAAQAMVDETADVLRLFRREREILVQKGITEPTGNQILGRLPGFLPADAGKRYITQAALFSQNQKDIQVCAKELLQELGVFSADASLPLLDLFEAIQGTGRTTVRQGEPYYVSGPQSSQLIGLSSTRQELKGLSVNVKVDDLNNQVNINLFGDSSFWLRTIESARTRE